MSTKIVVLVTDGEDRNRGELTLFDSPTEAERHVESLLDSGLEQERLRVLAGAEVDPQVSRRSVVALPIGNGHGPTPSGNGSGRARSVFATAEREDEKIPRLNVQAEHLLASEDGTPEVRLSDQAPIETVPTLPEKRGRHRS